MQRLCARVWPAGPRPERVDAVDGRRLWETDRGRLLALLTPQAADHLGRPHRLCNSMRLNSPAAVGCTCSHLLCWQRVRARGRPALILEDDCCVERPDELRGAIGALGSPAPSLPLFSSDRGGGRGGTVGAGRHPVGRRAAGTGWGAGRALLPASHPRDRWVSVPSSWARPGLRRPVPGSRPALTTWESDVFGSHAYLVTPAGAARLLERALPMEVHVDVYLALLSVLGRVRGHAWPRNLVTQCQGWLQASIPHLDIGLFSWKQLLPDLPLALLLLATGMLTVLFVLVAACGRDAGKV